MALRLFSPGIYAGERGATCIILSPIHRACPAGFSRTVYIAHAARDERREWTIHRQLGYAKGLADQHWLKPRMGSLVNEAERTNGMLRRRNPA